MGAEYLLAEVAVTWDFQEFKHEQNSKSQTTRLVPHFSRVKIEPFFLAMPTLGNQDLEDVTLRAYLKRHIPQQVCVVTNDIRITNINFKPAFNIFTPSHKKLALLQIHSMYYSDDQMTGKRRHCWVWNSVSISVKIIMAILLVLNSNNQITGHAEMKWDTGLYLYPARGKGYRKQ